MRAWFNFGFFYFQPSELLKVILVIFLASYLNEHREVVAQGYQLGPLTLPPLPYLLPLVGMWGMAMGLIIFQRDLGAALLLFSVFLAMLYVATNSGMVCDRRPERLRHRLVRALQRRRRSSRPASNIWLDPWATAQSTGYQIVQAIYALASGGVLRSRPGSRLPDRRASRAYRLHLYRNRRRAGAGRHDGRADRLPAANLSWLPYRLQRVSGRFRGFEQLMAVGLTTILAVQSFIIIGGNLRLSR